MLFWKHGITQWYYATVLLSGSAAIGWFMRRLLCVLLSDEQLSSDHTGKSHSVLEWVVYTFLMETSFCELAELAW